MAWIKVQQGVSDHRKTMAMARTFSADQDLIVGKLVRFWTWALDQAEDDGLLPDLTEEQLGQLAGWKRKPATFIASMVDAGFLEQRSEHRYAIHDWKTYAGKLNAKRQKDRERKGYSGEDSGVFPDGIQTETSRKNSRKEREKEKELDRDQDNDPIGVTERTDQDNGAGGFTPSLSPPVPDEAGFAGEYQRHYERLNGKHAPATHIAAALQLERTFGFTPCFQLAEDLAWSKPPNYLKPILEERKDGRPSQARRATGRGSRSTEPDAVNDAWDREAARQD